LETQLIQGRNPVDITSNPTDHIEQQPKPASHNVDYVRNETLVYNEETNIQLVQLDFSTLPVVFYIGLASQTRSFLYWTCQPNASGNGLQILVPDFLHVGRKPSQYISNASKMPVGIRFTIEYIPRSWKPLIPLAVTSLPV